MKILSRVAFGLVFAMPTWSAIAADFYWSCTTPIGTRYADATQCDKGDVGVKILKNGAVLSAVPEFSGTANAAHVCPKDPAVCQRSDFGVTADTPRAHAIARFMRQKECEFLQRFPNRCARPQ